MNKKKIFREYKNLLKCYNFPLIHKDLYNINKAFCIALEAHNNVFRKSGDPYICHSISVAKICVSEIGLGITSIICSLLHDCIEDSNITFNYIKDIFGEEKANIIDGLTKISKIFNNDINKFQVDNFRKMMLSISNDFRVILIKLADRLHNMRTLQYMPKCNQVKTSHETLYIYAPLAHRIGLYSIKSELEDLSMKYTNSKQYYIIANKLKETKYAKNKFIKKFIKPIKNSLISNNIQYSIFSRYKSIYSIWNKINNKDIDFSDLYDLFAVRIVINSNDKSDCWKVYSIVTDHYYPNTNRLRDWISNPKNNGYQSLHTTVRGYNEWVEVQIRTKNMDEIAEKGFAAHWKYKENNKDCIVETWINKVRLLLNNNLSDDEFIDNFKINLFSDEIFVYTPKGELIRLPKNSTAIDFAFEIHTYIGMHCIGAVVNYKLVSLTYILKNNDHIKIIVSNKQTPKEDWLNHVITSKAKNKIKSFLLSNKNKYIQIGKKNLYNKMHDIGININNYNLNKLLSYYKVNDLGSLYYKFYNRKIFMIPNIDKSIFKNIHYNNVNNNNNNNNNNNFTVVKNNNLIKHELSSCCNPILGDSVFGFVSIHHHLKIHRTSCNNASRLISNYNYRIVEVKWNCKCNTLFTVKLKINGINQLGTINKLRQKISDYLNINIKCINISNNNEIYNAIIILKVKNINSLKTIIQTIKNINGVYYVNRL